MKRRNPLFRCSRYSRYCGQRGVKLEEEEEDLSPEICLPEIPKSETPPPPQCPDLGKSVRPRPLHLPVPDDPFWRESRLRRLPHYFYRHLSTSFYPAGRTDSSSTRPCTITEGETPKSDPSAIGVVVVGSSDVAPLEDRCILDTETQI